MRRDRSIRAKVHQDFKADVKKAAKKSRTSQSNIVRTAVAEKVEEILDDKDLSEPARKPEKEVSE